MRNKIEFVKQKLKNIKLLKGMSKEKKIIGILAVLLIGFLLYQSLIATQLLRLKAIDFQFISQKRLLDSYIQLIRHVDNLVKEAKEKENRLSRVRIRFISEEELPNYFTNFRNLVKSYNLEVISLDFKPQEVITNLGSRPLEYFQRLPLDISLRGGYFNTMFLLYKLERDAIIFDIKSIRIKQESPDSYSVLTDMKAVIYILMKKT